MSKRIHKVSSLGVVLALLYFAFALFVLSQHYEGSWGGFLLFWTSFPASLLTFIFPGGRMGGVLLVVVGVSWWYLVGHYSQNRGRNTKEIERRNR
jgi:hypothetical protein